MMMRMGINSVRYRTLGGWCGQVKIFVSVFCLILAGLHEPRHFSHMAVRYVIVLLNWYNNGFTFIVRSFVLASWLSLNKLHLCGHVVKV